MGSDVNVDHSNFADLCTPHPHELIPPSIDMSRYCQLLDEIHQCYLDQREQLLSPSITSTITELTNQNSKDHCALVRHDWFKAELPFGYSQMTFELAENAQYGL